MIIWNTHVSQDVIRGSMGSLQTSVPPLEAAGMKDKKDMIDGNVVVSSYTGGPVQQVTNILHHGVEGNGIFLSRFTRSSLQNAWKTFQRVSMRYIYIREGRTADQLEGVPQQAVG